MGHRLRRKDKEAALECLRRVGIADYASRQISKLSGGQQQRVFQARALAQDAEVYFMDEPFAGVDATTEAAIVSLLRELKDNDRTALVVHHELQTVPDYIDDVVLLNMRIVAAGPTGEVFTRDNLQKTYDGRLTLLDKAAEAVASAGRRPRPENQRASRPPSYSRDNKRTSPFCWWGRRFRACSACSPPSGYADIAPSHVDRDADEVEHVLADDVVRELERALLEQSRIPPSPHSEKALA